MVIHPIIRQIVDRCHVSETHEEVLEYAISRLKEGQITFDAMPKKDQTKFKRQVKTCHSKNIKQYCQIMNGTF